MIKIKSTTQGCVMRHSILIFCLFIVISSTYAQPQRPQPPRPRINAPEQVEEQMKAYNKLREDRLREQLRDERPQGPREGERPIRDESQLKQHHKHAARLTALDDVEQDVEGAHLQASHRAFLNRMIQKQAEAQS